MPPFHHNLDHTQVMSSPSPGVCTGEALTSPGEALTSPGVSQVMPSPSPGVSQVTPSPAQVCTQVMPSPSPGVCTGDTLIQPWCAQVVPSSAQVCTSSLTYQEQLQQQHQQKQQVLLGRCCPGAWATAGAPSLCSCCRFRISAPGGPAVLREERGSM